MIFRTLWNPRRSRCGTPWWLVSFGLVAAIGCEDCLKRVPIDEVAVHPYPSCDGDRLPEGEVVASGHLRSGPGMRESIVERYEYRKHGCLLILRLTQEWPRGVSEVEVVYDEAYRPLRAWKRMTLPGADEVDDVRLYELRSDPATMSWRGEEGLRHFWFRGSRPFAVIGPGRGMISALIRAHPEMAVGETVRGPVLDFRRLVERVEEVALRRDPDREVPELGGRVRVYTVFGRESVFTDDEGWVIGDLAGLRPDHVLESEAPEPLPTLPPVDPRAPL